MVEVEWMERKRLTGLLLFDDGYTWVGIIFSLW